MAAAIRCKSARKRLSGNNLVYLPGREKRKKSEDDSAERHKEASRRSDDHDLEKLRKAYEALEAAHKEIRESHIEMIMNLAIAAEYKDPDTGNHILRISDYSNELAKMIDLSEEDREILRYASPMHDIGKIGIPDRILQKPDKLTPQEWEIMKQHTEIGWRMFCNSKSPLLKAVADIALSHHERFDGAGYPHGKKGNDIPFFGRIVAIADIFDAVVSERCYKKGWSFNEGIDYIRSLAGTHLDPELVSVFVRNKKQVADIYDANVTIQKYINEFKNQKPDAAQ